MQTTGNTGAFVPKEQYGGKKAKKKPAKATKKRK
jgi:hypothetical protein